MKILATMVLVATLAGSAFAQGPTPAAKGVTYGTTTTEEGAVPVTELSAKMSNDQFSGKISGKVTEVCQERGCWMKLEKSNGEAMMVKFKDYGFFMPKDIVGHDVVLDGEAVVKEVSVKQQKHYAQDAGKTKAEIDKIKAPKKETQFIAKGVLVL
ncbi:DUF4920 domain-containing protein [Flavihumibacter petaseus]|nr:DUF4920 domain-containing protein [Flavihumibacter petaseus]